MNQRCESGCDAPVVAWDCEGVPLCRWCATAEDQAYEDWIKSMKHISFTVVGTPAPQGSKNAMHHRHSNKIILLDSSKRTRPWKEAVKAEAAIAMHPQRRGELWTVIQEPCSLILTFLLARPKKHYYPVTKSRHKPMLRPDAPLYPAGKPDLDKLVRSTMDALTEAGVYSVDALVVEASVSKIYLHEEAIAAGRRPGAVITVCTI